MSWSESWSDGIRDLDFVSRCERSNADNWRVSTVVSNQVWRFWRFYRNLSGSSALGSISVLENANKGGVGSNGRGAVSDEYAVDITSAEFYDFLSGLPI